MVWWKASDDFADRPAVQALSDAAFRLHVEANLRASHFLTDGAIEDSWVARQVAGRWPGQLLADELVAAGLWERAEGGFSISGFLVDQPSRALVEARRASERRKKQNQRTRPPADFADPMTAPLPSNISSIATPTVETTATLASFEAHLGSRLNAAQRKGLRRLEEQYGEAAIQPWVEVACSNAHTNPVAYLEECLRKETADVGAGEPGDGGRAAETLPETALATLANPSGAAAVWNEVQDELRAELNAHAFRSAFSGTAGAGYDGDELIVTVPARSAFGALTGRLATSISRAAHNRGIGGYRFVLAPAREEVSA